MGERPSRGSRQRNRRVRARKADTISPVRVCGRLRVESFAVGSSACRISASAFYGTKARGLDLRCRQIVSIGAGTGSVATVALKRSNRRVGRRGGRGTLLFQRKPHL